jgi:cell division protein FtsB
MNRLQVILALIALLLWIGTYCWFFNHQLAEWRRQRAQRRREAAKGRQAQAEQRRRLNEELAAKYLGAKSGPSAGA